MDLFYVDAVTLLGLAAATLTTLAFLPQVLKTWRSKSAEDLSVGTFSLFCAGVVLWLIYGLIISDLPIIVANTVTLVLQITILAQIAWYRGGVKRKT